MKPSSSPRGERAGTPGVRWESELRSTGEQVVADDEGEPLAWSGPDSSWLGFHPTDQPDTPNRATRRAIARAARRKR